MFTASKRRLSENKDKLDAAAAGEIEAAIAESKTALARRRMSDAMNNAFERLQTASHKLAEVLYSQTAAPGGEAGSGGAGIVGNCRSGR